MNKKITFSVPPILFGKPSMISNFMFVSSFMNVREDTHNKVLLFSGRTTKRGEGVNPPNH